MKEQLDQWRTNIPSSQHFKSLPYHLPHVEQQLHLPVLDGLGLLNSKVAKKMWRDQPQLHRQAQQTIKALRSEFKNAANKALDHRKFLLSL